MDADDGPGRWIATVSALFTMLLAFGVVGIYFYGRAQPKTVEVSVQAELNKPQAVVWDLLADPSRRPEWRPFVDRVGQIADDNEGREVWRELDHSGDRFDFAVVSRLAPKRLVIEVSSVDQIGMEGRWIWELSSQGNETVIQLTERTAIDNPLWRGLNRLTRDPYETVEMEVGLLAEHLGSPSHIERL